MKRFGSQPRSQPKKSILPWPGRVSRRPDNPVVALQNALSPERESSSALHRRGGAAQRAPSATCGIADAFHECA
jgi:hypothetical protein